MTKQYLAYVLGILLIWLARQSIRSARGVQFLYLLASYLFYASFGLQFLTILLASSLFNYAWGSLVRRRPTNGILWTGILLNVGLLSVFKYLPTFAAPFANSSELASRVAHLALPIGISFWTFQGLSYLFDQYRGEQLDPSLLEFLLYMGFAPTVLSGPICRLPELLPQLRQTVRLSWENVSAGAQDCWVGIFMIVLARYLGSGSSGHGIDWGFAQINIGLGGMDVWLLLVAYGFQIFFDFAGYSRVVIGVARMFGILLPENFHRPYLSTTPSVFWTRWHMTLSFWIRDYIFLPLATMRREVWWRNSTVVLSMVLFGLWHKASWLFLLWGLYQGLILLGHRLLQQWQRRTGISVPGTLGDGLSWLMTFTLMTLGWILFRAPDLQQAGIMFRLALTPFSSHAISLPREFYALVIGVVAVYFVLEAMKLAVRREGPVLSWIPMELRFSLYAIIFYFAVFHTAQPQAFIYFQF